MDAVLDKQYQTHLMVLPHGQPRCHIRKRKHRNSVE